MIPLTAIFAPHQMTMSHHLTNKYWESLGPNGPFLHKLFHNQSWQLVQLQTAKNTLDDCALETQSDVTDAATKATSSIVQAILTNMLTGSYSLWSTRAAELENFNRSRDKAKQFVQSIHVASQCNLTCLWMKG